ncbi:MAG: universal stress protein [Cyclobacteriaceae bacterium]
MKSIEHLLLAVPASGNYANSTSYAIRLAKKLSAKITVALVYTCNEELVGQIVQSQNALQSQKQAAKTQFRQLGTQLQEANLDYKLVSIDGPFSNALVVASHSYHPDLIITIADQNLELKQVIQQVPNHLLLIPSHYNYRPIRLVGLAHNPQLLPDPQLMNFISQFANEINTTVEVIEFGQECTTESPFSRRANAELDYLFRNITHRFYLEECQHELTECISHYTDNHKVDMIMISGRNTQAFPAMGQYQPLIDVITESNVPVMILK